MEDAASSLPPDGAQEEEVEHGRPSSKRRRAAGESMKKTDEGDAPTRWKKRLLGDPGPMDHAAARVGSVAQEVAARAAERASGLLSFMVLLSSCDVIRCDVMCSVSRSTWFQVVAELKV
eukprot:CAMPEP_0119547268 /NCGR_PEP_ID=MMETSP1352-20130426/1420_1 /TAXON_ID=265584 /ORGANISM="Stauroneis constricta, Strain CCMP1120" /LENGTH=118 /DNA_ID=CAMNT_0007592131 /DNA_START=131 /DNA_END=487 /DNA_ORIENTATION=+